jgi:hypothetical protein
MRNDLTSTNGISTLLLDVDATGTKLMQQLENLERERGRISHQIDSIRLALSLAGIKPGKPKISPSSQEVEYVSNKPFSEMSLPDACLKILKDHQTQWLSKAEIEFLIVRGGYKFSTKNSKNSVGVTLQRMKDEGKCDAQTVRGSRGNLYCWYGERSADATSTNDNRK